MRRPEARPCRSTTRSSTCQYARRLAEGGFFSFVAGDGYSSGATSLLWPVLLAPFHALGLRDLSLVYAAWALGLVFHAALAVETARLARPLAGPAAAAGAGAMCAGFAAFAWFAWSGMETVAFAWILTRTARLAGALCEPDPREPAADSAAPAQPPSAPAQPPTAWNRPLPRALRLRRAPASPGGRPRLPARRGRARPLGVTLRASSTAPGASPPRSITLPRRRSPALRRAPARPRAAPRSARRPDLEPAARGPPDLLDDLRQVADRQPQLRRTDARGRAPRQRPAARDRVIDGGQWTAVFLPEGSAAVIALGAVALAVAAHRRGRPAHAAIRGGPRARRAAALHVPQLPLEPRALRLALRAGVDRHGRLPRARARRRRPAAPALARLRDAPPRRRVRRRPGRAAAVGHQRPRQSARAIDRQQVWLGRWAAQHLPEDARIGVNDTGALAYFSGRRTFDVVGLTTEGEARYWVAGAGSRFEHYEKLPPERRPTHFIVYPHWMACAPVLGRELVDATVEDQAILGGTDDDRLRGALGPPRLRGRCRCASVPGERILDELDVSDLKSEAAHAYALDPLADQRNMAIALAAPESSAPGELDLTRPELADGGRQHRTADRFVAHLAAPPAEARLVLRVASDDGAELAVSVAGQDIGTVDVPRGPWVERALPLPAARLSTPTPNRDHPAPRRWIPRLPLLDRRALTPAPRAAGYRSNLDREAGRQGEKT